PAPPVIKNLLLVIVFQYSLTDNGCKTLTHKSVHILSSTTFI
ncbi:MAG: hypothetical protein ACI9MF_002949, partial [Gammaproteobacteria bacterium]